jgi:tripartite-type tricarboxylate transporter receptor subunit TctC
MVMLVGAPEGAESDRMARVFAGFLGPRLDAPEPGGVSIDVRDMPGDGGRTMLAALGDATPGDLVTMLANAVRAVTEGETFRRQSEAVGIYAAWADGPGWRAQMDLEQAALARLWQTDPWLSSSSG